MVGLYTKLLSHGITSTYSLNRLLFIPWKNENHSIIYGGWTFFPYMLYFGVVLDVNLHAGELSHKEIKSTQLN